MAKVNLNVFFGGVIGSVLVAIGVSSLGDSLYAPALQKPAALVMEPSERPDVPRDSDQDGGDHGSEAGASEQVSGSDQMSKEELKSMFDEAGASEQVFGSEQMSKEERKSTFDGAGASEQMSGSDQMSKEELKSTFDEAGASKQMSGSDSMSEEELKSMFANASPERGKRVAGKCRACHSMGADRANKIGPPLYGVVGRPVASVQEYSYSPAFQEEAREGRRWTIEALRSYLEKPKKYIPGTKMNFAGLRKEKDIRNLILYLNEQSDSPMPIPGR